MRNRIVWIALMLALLLCGCTAPAQNQTADNGEFPVLQTPDAIDATPDGTAPTSDVSGDGGELELPLVTPTVEPSPDGSESAPLDPVVPTDQTAQPPETQPVLETEPEPIPTSFLLVRSTCLYSGPFPEDGSDEPVESVAGILVENASNKQLQFAELHYLIDGREAVFRISELPAGESVVAVEQSRLVAMPVSEWVAQPEQEIATYLAAESAKSVDVSSEQDGTLSVTNNGAKTCTVDVMYKQRYDADTWLGGIAYHVRVEALAPGESRTVTAAHFVSETCGFVRISTD